MTTLNREKLEIIKKLRGAERYSERKYSDIPMDLRDDIYDFLTCETAIQALMTATYLKKPAIAALSPELVERFGVEKMKERRIKMYCGSATKHILLKLGFAYDKPDVIVTIPDNVFTCASRYKK